jgi:hypothetical protein
VIVINGEFRRGWLINNLSNCRHRDWGNSAWLMICLLYSGKMGILDDTLFNFITRSLEVKGVSHAWFENGFCTYQ